MADRDTSPNSIVSALSDDTVGTEQQPASRASSTASPQMSTPPTSLGDELSVLSDATKMEIQTDHVEIGEASTLNTFTEVQASPQAVPEPPASDGRRSARNSTKKIPTYNVQILAGTAIHTPTKYLEKHHKNVLHGPIDNAFKTNTGTPPKRRVSKALSQDISDPVEAQIATEAAEAAQRRKSARGTDLRRDALRNLTNVTGAVAQKGSELQSLYSSFTTGIANMLHGAPLGEEMGARMTPNGTEDSDPGQQAALTRPKTKKWEQQGLYVSQYRDFDARLSESTNRTRRKSKKSKDSEVLPLPMFAGERLLNEDRDFKLPFDVYHPLPRKVKVDGWVKLHKNRFIGDASALWKRDKQDSSQCYCLPEDGCGEACHNRIMAYECDSTNCRLTPDQCGNRPFAELKRRAKGNRYEYGVEVLDTADRGYGVRAMRCFDPFQIIVEYAGEIITQAECERRMKQIYKKDKCYYLMSFDNKMIIDATRGTIARFVNHSCEPNCEMIKWTVSGEPRMALFAGSRGIMTGEELTYDYNFDPFSSKNIQTCRCGTPSCRGVLGPKPKHQPQSSTASALLAGTKRKLGEFFGSGSSSSSAPNSPKKRKLTGERNIADIKARNAEAQSTAAQLRAKQEANDRAAQIASRKDRAMQRSAAISLSKRSRIAHKITRHSLPVHKMSRKTTFNFQRRAPKAISKPAVAKRVTEVKTRTSPIKRISSESKSKGPKTPVKDLAPDLESDPGSESDSSPNITPASLRSATRKLAASAPGSSSSRSAPLKYTQTKLSFQPSKSDSASRSRDSIAMVVPDSDEEESEVEESASAAKRGRERTASGRFVGAGFKTALTRGFRGTKRAVGVPKAGTGKGLRGMNGA